MVDEIMVLFIGRMVHIVKIRNKPMKEGYKMWLIGFNSYVSNFLYYLAIHTRERTRKSLRVKLFNSLKAVTLALTF